MYQFKFKRRLFWKTFQVIGHQYFTETDKMVVYFTDGGVQEIPHWKDCAIRLGADWVAEQKRNMEQKVGQTIPLNIVR